MDEIKIFINNNMKDKFNDLLLKYSNELEDYDLVDSLSEFSVLPLKGSIRYINKYSKEIRFGGLLIKIYEKYGNYFAILKKMNGKKYHVSFNNNFIFYKKSSNDNFRDSLKYFISDYDKGIYTTD
jgi:phospholipid N-methyltransferase